LIIIYDLGFSNFLKKVVVVNSHTNTRVTHLEFIGLKRVNRGLGWVVLLGANPD